MKDLVTDFQTHADKMGQIASFAAASSTDAKRKFFFPVFLETQSKHYWGFINIC